MWKCHKCGKPVYFAERKQSLGYDWHPECLRCEECGKRLNPGQHAEHKGVPYCHVPCYGALFGPQLFGHGTRVESHKSYGVKGTQRSGSGNCGPVLPRDHLESKLKVYNQFYDNNSMEIRSREVNNRLILEGALRVSWGVHGVIHLKEDDDQRLLVVRKRNSKRVSKAAEDSPSDKENDISESIEAPTTASEVENLSTDISLSESMTFDSCSLNEYPLTDLPTTPEEASANTTGITDGGAMPLINGSNGSANDEEKSESTSTLCGTDTTITTASTSCISTTLPSKLDNLEKLEWDEIDDLLQVERRISEKDKIYETMPVKLPSSQTSSSESSPSKTISAHNLTESTNTTSEVPSPSTPTSGSITNNNSNSNSNSESSSTSSDNFVTATSATINSSISGTTSTTTTTTVDNFESSEDATLKPMDFEEFKRSVHLDYVSGANSFRDHNEDSLKRNQPIDPSRIHDSLKLYGESPMSKSFNCEHALRSIDANFVNDTLYLKAGTASPHSMQRMYALQKSGSASITAGGMNHPNRLPNNHAKGINRSKSGPSCFDYSDSDDDDSTLKPQESSTIRRSDVQPRYVKIEMDCYPKEADKKDKYKDNDKESASEGDSSRADAPSITVTNSGAAGGDELTQTEDMITASEGRGLGVTRNGDDDDDADPPLHVTEDGVVLRRPPRTGAAAIKRRSGNRRSRTKLKRRCSINGHFYNRETSFFTPPYGSQMSVWVTSLVTAHEVINLLLEKYKVDSAPENFSLFIIRDNGEQKRLKETDYPLVTRVMMGPHEDVARLFLVDAKKTDEISNEVAQFLNLSLPECRAILERYDDELEREVAKVRERYAELRRRIINRMESLKVHL